MHLIYTKILAYFDMKSYNINQFSVLILHFSYFEIILVIIVVDSFLPVTALVFSPLPLFQFCDVEPESRVVFVVIV